MTSFILGAGEVGRSLHEVVGGLIADKDWRDPDLYIPSNLDILHICFPYFEGFVEEVKEAQAKFRPKYTVIFSTVKEGTSRQCGAVHSPVVGIHPELAQSIRTFPRFLSGEQASEVADYFRRLGLKVYLFDKPEATEIMKQEDTTLYGVAIEHTKHIKRRLAEAGVPFEAWTIYTDAYNKGYQALNHSEFTRPNLVPIMKKISGHCVLQNCELSETPFTKLVKELNS